MPPKKTSGRSKTKNDEKALEKKLAREEKTIKNRIKDKEERQVLLMRTAAKVEAEIDCYKAKLKELQAKRAELVDSVSATVAGSVSTVADCKAPFENSNSSAKRKSVPRKIIRLEENGKSNNVENIAEKMSPNKAENGDATQQLSSNVNNKMKTLMTSE